MGSESPSGNPCDHVLGIDKAPFVHWQSVARKVDEKKRKRGKRKMNIINEGLVASFALLIIVLIEILIALFTTRAGRFLPKIRRIAGLEAMDRYVTRWRKVNREILAAIVVVLFAVIVCTVGLTIELLGIPSLVNAFLNIDVVAIGGLV